MEEETEFSSANKPEAAKLVTLTDIVESYYEWRQENPSIPSRLEMSAELYKHISHEAAPEHLDEKKRKKMKLQGFYGMKIKVDPELKPGEWKIVSKAREPLYWLDKNPALDLSSEPQTAPQASPQEG